MNHTLYQEYLLQYLRQAYKNSDGTPGEIEEGLGGIVVGNSFLVRHKEEKQRALRDALAAFGSHRHWPLDMILLQLGLKREDLTD